MPSPSCAYDDGRLRLPPASPARNSKAGKKESTGRRLSQLCPPYATPSSNASLDHRRSDARIVENGFATSGGVSKSAKVVLAPRKETQSPGHNPLVGAFSCRLRWHRSHGGLSVPTTGVG